MRHFLIGNGHSILDTPLDLLKGEVTWGINRPPIKTTYYVCLDVSDKDHDWQRAVDMDCKKVFLWDGFKGQFFGNNIEWLTRCIKSMHHYYAADNTDKRAESWHLPDICTAFGSMYPAMQLAVMNGATEIYLVGCDLFTGKNDHYDGNYPEFADWKERNLIENHLHTVSRRSCPVPVYNATVGGNLEVYPRVDIHKILKVDQLEVDQIDPYVLQVARQSSPISINKE